MIIVKIKAISQGYCETQILRCFKAFGKVSRHACGYEGELADPSTVAFSLSICFERNSSNQSVMYLLLPQRDSKPHRSTGFFLLFQCLKFKQ